MLNNKRIWIFFMYIILLFPISIKIGVGKSIYFFIQEILFVGLFLYLLFMMFNMKNRENIKGILYNKLFWCFIVFVIYILIVSSIHMLLNKTYDIVAVFKLLKYLLYSVCFVVGYKVLNYINISKIFKISTIIFLIATSINLLIIFCNFMMNGIPSVSDLIWLYGIDIRLTGFSGICFDIHNLNIDYTNGFSHGIFGNYIVLMIIIFLSNYIFRGSKKYLLLSIYGLPLLLFTFSRASLLNLFVCLLVIIFYYFMENDVNIKRRIRNLFIVLIVTFILSQLILSFFGIANVFSKFSMMLDSLSSQGILDGSSGMRLSFWKDALNTILKSPINLIFGYGYGNTLLSNNVDNILSTPESLLIGSLVWGGLIGLILISLLWFEIIKLGLKWRKIDCIDKKLFLYAISVFSIGFLIPNLINGEDFLADLLMSQFFFYLGIVIYITQTNVDKKKEKETSPINVLHISVRADYGGGPEHINILCKELSKYHVNNYICCPNQIPYYNFFKEDTLGVCEIPISKVSISALISVWRYCKKNNINLIHSHGFGAGIYSRILGLMTGIPIVHTTHGIHINKEDGLKYYIKIYLERFLSLFTCKIINVSENEQNEAKIYNLYPLEKSIVINNGIYIDKFHINENSNSLFQKLGIKEESYVIGTIARLTPPKGINDLIEAFSLLDIPNKILIIVGDGEERTVIEELIEKRGLTQQVKLLGARSDIPRILKYFNIYVSTSLMEGMPISLLEASCSKIPIVATNVPGNNDIICDNYNGFLCKVSNPCDIAEKIMKMYCTSTKEKMIENGYNEILDKYSSNIMAQKVLSIYKEFVD